MKGDYTGDTEECWMCRGRGYFILFPGGPIITCNLCGGKGYLI